MAEIVTLLDMMLIGPPIPMPFKGDPEIILEAEFYENTEFEFVETTMMVMLCPYLDLLKDLDSNTDLDAFVCSRLLALFVCSLPSSWFGFLGFFSFAFSGVRARKKAVTNMIVLDSCSLVNFWW